MRLTKLLLFSLVTLFPPHWAHGQSPFSSTPGRVVGQVSVTAVSKSVAPNLVEGKELWFPHGVALDTSISPPAVYVSDTGNNRVLGWRNASSFANGAYADVVIGQRDEVSTFAQGPFQGSSLSRGLNAPTGLAVDARGNLYVVDAGNNRILRYPKPLDPVVQPDQLKQPDLVIGQASFDSSRSPNRGGAITASGISSPVSYSLNVGSGSVDVPLTQSLAFDGSGNLWFTDTGNHRVLRYPASGQDVATTADIVLGQTSTATAVAAGSQTDKTLLRYPSGVVVDQAGRIYVSDELARVAVYSPNPPALGAAALRLLGIIRVPQGQLPPSYPNDTALGAPKGVVMIGNRPAVLDAGNNRILVFDPYELWPPDSLTASSPKAKSVIGQTAFSDSKASATNTGLSGPFSAAFAGSELFVADTFNNRAVVFPETSTVATRVLGQRDFGYSAPNLIEGRELYLFDRFYQLSGLSGVYFSDSGGLVVDAQSDPPHLYIADTYNNRILGYRDGRKVRPGDTADLVIGQPDFFSSLLNYDAAASVQPNDASRPTDTGLSRPAGLAVDADGNLWVADRANGRVLRFPKPFEQTQSPLRPNLVLGQSGLFSRNTDPSDQTMAMPYGVALIPEGHLLVSDMAHSRVLLFKKPDGGDFSSGMRAAAVIGQPDFYSTSTATGLPSRMVSPRGIAADSSGRLYVCDTGNNRILVYSQVASVTPGSDPSPVAALANSTLTDGLHSPQGVFVDQATGAIWVAESQAGHVQRYPEFTQMLGGNVLPDYTLTTSTSPLALTVDGSGNLLVAESANRVSLYYPPLWVTNGANFLPDAHRSSTWLQPCCAPGSIATLWPFSTSGSFPGIGEAHFNTLPNPVPLPTTLGDVQLLIDHTPAPLYDVYSSQINFQVPQNTPSSGPVDVVLMRASTGETLANGSVTMAPASPGLLTNQFPTGSATLVQVAAQNGDDHPPSCNGPVGTPSDTAFCPGGVRPAKKGEVVTLYATGQGFIAGMPADGAQATGSVTTDLKPQVMIGTQYVPDSSVEFSGLAPSLIGVWQINVKVPDWAPPGPAKIYIVYKDTASMVSGYPGTVIQVQ